ncbi:MAG: LemA family protein [Gammaproteobacteria bacterium]|nr:LemA family protein [Gammaproteobacteria bacterium]
MWFFITALLLALFAFQSRVLHQTRVRTLSHWQALDESLKKRLPLLEQLNLIAKQYAINTELLEKELTLLQNVRTLELSQIRKRAALETRLYELSSPIIHNEDLRTASAHAVFYEQWWKIDNEFRNAQWAYNLAASKLNSMTTLFPISLIAKPMGWTQAPYFELDA